MNWINLRTELFRSPEFLNCKPGAVETWLKVLAYCCEQENGGKIPNGKGWNNRCFSGSCGVSRQEIDDASPLVYFEGEDLFVMAYPSEKQAEVQAKRRSGKKGGLSRGKSTASSTPPTEGEGKENRNKKEKENNSASLKQMCSEIYEAYPRREAKPKALQAIGKALTKVGFEDLLHRTKKFAVSRNGQDKQFTPLPATWFNQERYNDDPSNWLPDSKPSVPQNGGFSAASMPYLEDIFKANGTR